MAYRILVVDDEPDARDLLDYTLRRAGHHVDSVSNGRQALELFAENSYEYDVILTDVRMPGVTGEDLYRRINREWPHLARRVAFVTASSPSDVFLDEHGGRPIPLLTKPYTYERLLRLVEGVVAYDT